MLFVSGSIVVGSSHAIPISLGKQVQFTIFAKAIGRVVRLVQMSSSFQLTRRPAFKCEFENIHIAAS